MRLGFVALLAIAGCTFDTAVPDGALLRCAGAVDCIAPAACFADVGLCVEPSTCLEVADGVARAVADGNACTEDGNTGICLRGACVEPTCGDGLRTDPEACDDGNADDADACTTSCSNARCGDGSVQRLVEVCDDGNTVSGDGCAADCGKLERCGDAFVDEGEACDDGNAADDDACTSACVEARCGDGIVRTLVEACDDANVASGDGCSADCQKVELCGDGVVDVGEECDDQNDNPSDRCHACELVEWSAEVVVGDALRIQPLGSVGMARSRDGSIFMADTGNHRVLRRRADGRLLFVAGSGEAVFSGDGGPAASAGLDAPISVAIDGFGRLLIADAAVGRVRRVELDGRIETIAGGGPLAAGTLEIGAAVNPLQVDFVFLGGIEVARDGRIAIVDIFASRIYIIGTDGLLRVAAGRRILDACVLPGPAPIDDADNDGLIDSDEVLAGTNPALTDTDGDGLRDGLEVDSLGTDANNPDTDGDGVGDNDEVGDGGLALDAAIVAPASVAFERDGSLLFTQVVNGVVRRVRPDGVLERVAGVDRNGICGPTRPAGPLGDGGPALDASLDEPFSVAPLADGRILIADSGHARIREVDVSGTIRTVAGTGVPGEGVADGTVDALSVALRTPRSVIEDGDGFVINDAENARVLRVDGTGLVQTLVRGGDPTIGDGMLASGTALALNRPLFFAAEPGACGIVVDGPDVVFADTFGARVLRVEPTGFVSTVLDSRDVVEPTGLAREPDGSLLIGDRAAFVVLRLSPSGDLSVAAGTGIAGDSGDEGPATAAALTPNGIALDGAGGFYVADVAAHRVRHVDAAGVIHAFAGTGEAGSGGDQSLALAATLDEPFAVAADALGNVFIADARAQRIRVVTSGIIDTFVGTGSIIPSPDGPLASSRMVAPRGLWAQDGDLYVSEGGAHRVRRIRDGFVTTIAGTGAFNDTGDGYDALAATLTGPTGITVDAAGRVLFADAGNNRVRVVEDGVVSTVAGRVDPPNIGQPLASVMVGAVAAAPIGPDLLVATGNVGRVMRWTPDRVDVVVGYPKGAGARARFAPLLEDAAGIAFDALEDRLYISEATTGRIAVVDIVDHTDPSTWTIDTYTGDAPGFDDAPIPFARFAAPRGLAIDDATHTLYVADTGNHCVRAIDLDLGVVETIAGVPQTLGFFGDGGPAVEALFFEPEALAVAPDGALLVADTGNHRVRRVVVGGAVEPVIGDGSAASSGTGRPARDLPIDTPRGLAFDDVGNLFITSRTSVRLVTANELGVADGGGEVFTIYGAPPRDEFPEDTTTCLGGIRVLADGVLDVFDACQGYVVRVERTP